MMELRQAAKDEVQGNVQDTRNVNTGAMFSKLKQNLITEMTEYYVKLSENR
jgi:ribosomal protein RSM22 (predicted rRNA methylase)